jgi:glycosyltransferase involved in cell wall biosynthesis/GT2 family glycosyltransferase
MTPGERLPAVLRVYESAVVGPWRRRERELRRLGVDVATVAPRRWNEGGRDVHLVAEPGEAVAGVRTFGRHPYRFVYGPLGLWRALRRTRPGLLDVHEEPASLAAFETWLLARAAGIRAPFCLYSAENLPKRYPPPFRWIERFLLRRAAAVHSCNDEVEGRLRAKGFSGPVVNLGLGVDVERFDDERCGAATGSSRLPSDAAGGVGGEGCGLHVGFVGRLDERKGTFVLLDAVAALPAARVTFVGAGGAAAELAAAIEQRGLGGRATIEGFVAPDDLAATYRRFDVVAVPSLDTPRWSEQFGRVVVEAMAAGVPVVASDAGALAEVLGGAGMLVPQGDAEALAEALRRLAADTGLHTRLRRLGRARAQHFSWAAVAARQVALYRRMVADAAGPDEMWLAPPGPGTAAPDARSGAVDAEVLVVAYNSASLLPALFAALPPGQAVTVVDNASADESADVAERHGATVLRGAVNAGFAAACNRAARHSRAEVLVFLNPDAVITGPDLARLLAAFDDPTVAVAAPVLRSPDGHAQQVRWPYPSAGGAWQEALGLHRLRAGGGVGESFVVGACFAVRRAAFEAVGGFDERFWLYGEEADLCFRLEQRGWRIVTVTGAEARHVGRASEGSVAAPPALVAEHFARGGEHFVAKHRGPCALVLYRVAKLTGSLLRSTLHLGGRVGEHRSSARRTLTGLRRAPGTVALDSPATSAPRRGLVVCSLEPWDEVWRRNQFLVRELLDADPDLRVLFVEPAFDPLHEGRLGSQRRRAKGLRPAPGCGRVVRFEPVKWLPRRFGPWADRLRDRQVRRAVAALGFAEPALWVNDASYATLADDVAWPALYDITDDWTVLADRRGRAARAAEERLLQRCEAVVVCSPVLAERRRDRRPDVVLVPNAVDAEHLRAAQPRPADLPAGDAAVYAGTLHEDRLDVALVEQLAAALPDLAVVLVGPDALSARNRDRLGAHPNVRLLGARPYAEVPGYLQHAAVVIVPHLVDAFTDSLDPLKAYECLAVGRPTVATPVAGFRDAGLPVRAVPADRFVAEVEAVLRERPPGQPREVPSWAERAAAFQDQLARARARADDRARSRRLRVAFYGHCAKLSGAEKSFAELLPALHSVDPTVLLGEHGPLEDLLRAQKVPVEVLSLDAALAGTRRGDVPGAAVAPATLARSARYVLALARRLRALQPDVVSTVSLKGALLGGAAGRLAGVPVVWSLVDRIAPDYLPGAAVALVRVAARLLPTAIVANSHATSQTLPGRREVTAVSAPVDTAALARLERPRRIGPLRVVMLGRLASWKGQAVFLRAFAEAFPSGEEEAVVAGSALFGEDTYAAELHDLAQELGIADRVTFTGFVDDIESLLAGVDVLVHASVIPEPFGRVIVEAMAAGVSVVASDAGGPAEIITDGVDGLLCPPGDVAAMARCLRELAGDESRRSRLSLAGRRRAEDFHPEVVARRVEAVFRSVDRR